MSAYPIDRIPDERLARLATRRSTSCFVMVTLEDCAPFLTTCPLECDELRHALVRLLTVPDGPLVHSDGTPRAAPLTSMVWTVSDKPLDTLTLSDIRLGTGVCYTVARINLARVKYLVEYEVTDSLEQAKRLPWWPRIRDLLEGVVWCRRGDAMLAGLSAVREYSNNTQQGEET